MDNASQLFDDIVKLIKQYNVPGIQLDAILSSRRKDLEAMLEIGKTLQGGGQSIAQKQAEILRTSLEDLRNVLAAQTSADGDKVAAANETIQRAFGNVSELVQIALKSQSAAFDTLRARTEASLAEWRALLPIDIGRPQGGKE
ncbi:phasin family protein [Burkholderia cenocepacia]|uniref:phasin family protein n=1 Tax=Burkholderia cenocepacia TaxID=95486 RepID=UPI001F37A551|nr:phasin family protein [Burkholderia cenocepacia]MCF1369276.1 phasin family protein [Burkholderia cenocepacia]MCF1386693.1 phasin family protein [Burkholderia cenocepacia]